MSGGTHPSASSEPASGAAAGSAPVCPAPVAAPSPAPLGTPGWWAGRTFYEVFVRSFADGTGDGVGDLTGLIRRLDYLNDGDPATHSDLGVTGLWLMPIMPSPSYHGYDVTDFGSVQKAYGSVAQLRTLVRAAHARGIAVILDLPLNHTSDRDPWFKDSRVPGSSHADWYVWADQPGGNGWYRDGDRFYYANFGPTFPDLNLRDPAVTAALTSAARRWLTDVGVDGFRIDAAKHLIEDGPVTEDTPETHTWLTDFRSALRTTSPGSFLVGEVWDTSKMSASYVPASLDLAFDFGLQTVLESAVQEGRAHGLQVTLAKLAALYPTGGFGAFLSNHDMDRIASQLGSDPAKLRLAAELLLTGPGVPFVYYGEELGMTGQKPDPRIRTPMQWSAAAPAAGFSRAKPWEALSSDWRTVNVAAETTDPGSLLSTYRDLIALRAAHPALAEGRLVPVTATGGEVVATLRTTPTETLLVVANVGDTAADGYGLDLAAGPLCGSPTAAVIHGTGPASAPTVEPSGGFSGYRPLPVLPPRSVTVIALQP